MPLRNDVYCKMQICSICGWIQIISSSKCFFGQTCMVFYSCKQTSFNWIDHFRCVFYLRFYATHRYFFHFRAISSAPSSCVINCKRRGRPWLKFSIIKNVSTKLFKNIIANDRWKRKKGHSNLCFINLWVVQQVLGRQIDFSFAFLENILSSAVVLY